MNRLRWKGRMRRKEINKGNGRENKDVEVKKRKERKVEWGESKGVTERREKEKE